MLSKTRQCAYWIQFGVPCCVHHRNLNICINVDLSRGSNIRDYQRYKTKFIIFNIVCFKTQQCAHWIEIGVTCNVHNQN